MRVTAIETITYDDDADLTDTERDIDITTLRVHTDEGVVGLGETFPQAGMEGAALHGPIADHVLGADPRDVQGLRRGRGPRWGCAVPRPPSPPAGRSRPAPRPPRRCGPGGS
jgi:L-alanine-DL-glutamate epimerase-like enolase superfamily enzyme